MSHTEILEEVKLHSISSIPELCYIYHSQLSVISNKVLLTCSVKYLVEVRIEYSLSHENTLELLEFHVFG